MKRFLGYFLLGIFFVLLQSSLLPLMLTPDWRPSLILLLVLYIGISEELPQAIIGGLLLGALQDSFCGHSLGLYLSVYLIIVLATHLTAAQLNVESMPLLMLLVAAGTLLQNILLAALLTMLAETAPVLHILLPAIPQQLLANLLCALLALMLLLRFRRFFGFRPGLSGLIQQGNRHEF